MSQPFVTSENHAVEHGLIKEKVAHPLGDDYVNFIDGESDFFDLSLDDCDIFVPVVVFHDLLCVFSNVGVVDSVHMFGSRHSAKYTQDSCSTSDI